MKLLFQSFSATKNNSRFLFEVEATVKDEQLVNSLVGPLDEDIQVATQYFDENYNAENMTNEQKEEIIKELAMKIKKQVGLDEFGKSEMDDEEKTREDSVKTAKEYFSDMIFKFAHNENLQISKKEKPSLKKQTISHMNIIGREEFKTDRPNYFELVKVFMSDAVYKIYNGDGAEKESEKKLLEAYILDSVINNKTKGEKMGSGVFTFAVVCALEDFEKENNVKVILKEVA